jgi:hypothetical protein
VKLCQVKEKDAWFAAKNLCMELLKNQNVSTVTARAITAAILIGEDKEKLADKMVEMKVGYTPEVNTKARAIFLKISSASRE